MTPEIIVNEPDPGDIPAYREGDRRAVIARWTVTARLKMLSAAQIGSHQSDYCDQTFARDEDDRPVLPGTSLAGSLRSALSDRRAGYRAAEPPCVRNLFGSADDKGHESPLIVFDSTARAAALAGIRDGVCIQPHTGTARDKGKYDRELTLPGVEFPLRLDLVVTSGVDEEGLLRDLADALAGLTDDSIRLGGRRSRGLGRCKADGFRAIRYDLTTKEGWEEYASSDRGLEPLTARSGKSTAAAALATAGWTGTLSDAGDDQRKVFAVRFGLKIDGSLLIRSPGVKADDPDMVHLTEKGRSIISGSSLGGALRAHSLRLLNTIRALGMLTPQGRQLSIASLYGPRPEEVEAGARPQASRVRVNECTTIAKTKQCRQTRIKIDRFTGGVIDGALFDEQPTVGGTVGLELQIQNPKKVEIGLLALVLRDLAAGLVPIGGEAAIGRGILRGDDNGISGVLPGEQSFNSLLDLQVYVSELVSGSDATTKSGEEVRP